ncbi:hypothetical protein Zmor_000513 [Zophobas morio]|uniref:2Fe-2S ferredoxin-type domain-containing protein n=1 Tax=Zophobas morio TaxID=2755281 RepID=A0AA38MRC8_9CUCU|nr:hypothetical protein Zmor_000513 [Zophobas morio]
MIALSRVLGYVRRDNFIAAARKNYIRSIHSTCKLRHGEYEMQDPKSPDEVVNITYITKDGKKVPIKGKVGDNVLRLAQRYDIPMEGACEASLACTTCHVYIKSNHELPTAEPEEEDLLDMAPFLKECSRLGCQIVLTKDMEGLEIELPQATRNFYVDGHVPTPH